MRGFWKDARTLIQAYWLKGLIWSIPMVLTLWILSVVFSIADRIMGPVTRTLLNALLPDWLLVGPIAGGESPIVSFVLLALLLTILGGFVSWRYGENLVRAVDSVIKRVPGVGLIYRSTRTIAEFFDGSKPSPFERVVLVPYPHPGVYTVAFVAGHATIKDLTGKDTDCLKVVIPNPPTGVQGIVLVPEHLARDTCLTVEEGIQFYVSLGMVSPPVITVEEAPEKTSD